MTDKERIQEIDEVVEALLSDSVELFNFVSESYSLMDQLKESNEVYKKAHNLLVDSIEKQKSLQLELDNYKGQIQGLERSLSYGAKEAVRTAEKLHYAQKENKRYREAIKGAIRGFNQDEHQYGMSLLLKALEESK